MKNWRWIMATSLLLAALALLGADCRASLPNLPQASSGRQQEAAVLADDPSPPAETVKLIFIHHSCGENWLNNATAAWPGPHANNYFVSDTNYGWGPDGIATIPTLPLWAWFRGPSTPPTLPPFTPRVRSTLPIPAWPKIGGENQVIMFKSCSPTRIYKVTSVTRFHLSTAIP